MKIDFSAETNIFINLLEGDLRLTPHLEKVFAVSFISEIEFLGMQNITNQEVEHCQNLLNECLIIPYGNETKDVAIRLKQKIKISLPDAFIAATSLQYSIPILTFDKGFSRVQSIDLILLE